MKGLRRLRRLRRLRWIRYPKQLLTVLLSVRALREFGLLAVRLGLGCRGFVLSGRVQLLHFDGSICLSVPHSSWSNGLACLGLGSYQALAGESSLWLRSAIRAQDGWAGGQRWGDPQGMGSVAGWVSLGRGSEGVWLVVARFGVWIPAWVVELLVR